MLRICLARAWSEMFRRQHGAQSVMFESFESFPTPILALMKDFISEILVLRNENNCYRAPRGYFKGSREEKKCWKCGAVGHLERACCVRERDIDQNWRVQKEDTPAQQQTVDEGYQGSPVQGAAIESEELSDIESRSGMDNVPASSLTEGGYADLDTDLDSDSYDGEVSEKKEGDSSSVDGTDGCDKDIDAVLLARPPPWLEDVDDYAAENGGIFEDDDEKEVEDDDEDYQARSLCAVSDDGTFDDADSVDEEPTKASPTIELLMKLEEDLGESSGKMTEVFSNIGKLLVSSMNSEPTG